MLTLLIIFVVKLLHGFNSLECDPSNNIRCDIIDLDLRISDEILFLQEIRDIYITNSVLEYVGVLASLSLETNSSIFIQNSTLHSRIINITAQKIVISNSTISTDGTTLGGLGQAEDNQLFGNAHASPGTDCHFDTPIIDKSYGDICPHDFEKVSPETLLGSGGEEFHSFGKYINAILSNKYLKKC